MNKPMRLMAGEVAELPQTRRQLAMRLRWALICAAGLVLVSLAVWRAQA